MTSVLPARGNLFADARDDVEINVSKISPPKLKNGQPLEKNGFFSKKDPLALSMPRNQLMRDEAFSHSAKKQKVKSTDGWMKSIFMIEGRALDNIIIPQIIVTLNAIIWTIARELYNVEIKDYDDEDKWEGIYSIVVKSSLAFLLVFRLNRVAMRFWETRTMWGKIIVTSRSLVDGILSHAPHAPSLRDEAISWVAGFAVATMHFLRRAPLIPPDKLAGVLTVDEVEEMSRRQNPPLYAAMRARRALVRALGVREETPVSLAHAWSVKLSLLEGNINTLIAQLGGMEKIRSTPLPVVYVAHLRTCLIFYLLTLPYVWGDVWGWMTIPAVAFTAFALLGIEGAAMECEVPFDGLRANHLEMDVYCCMLLNNIQQLVVDAVANDSMTEYNKENVPLRIIDNESSRDRPVGHKRFFSS